MVTIQDIAEAADASIATVSRTLRGLPKRQTPIQKRILKVSRELGYQRPGGAGERQILLQGGQILFLDSAFADRTLAHEMHHGLMFKAIRQVIEPRGCSLMISSIAGHKPVPPALRSPTKLSGVMVHGYFTPAFFEKHLAGLPVVGLQFVDHRLPCSWVGTDNFSGMHQVVTHLYNLGHRRIAYFSGDVEFFHPKWRYRGYQEAMANLGLDIHPSWRLVWQRPSMDGVPIAPTELPDYEPRLRPAFANPATAPTAIVTSGNWAAWSAIAALRRMGLRVPEDVSVTGMGHQVNDGRQWADVGDKLTRLDDRMEAVTAAAAQLLLDQIDGRVERHPRVLLLGPKLIEGQTVQPVKQAVAAPRRKRR